MCASGSEERRSHAGYASPPMFGTHDAPRAAVRVTKPPLAYLRSLGVRLAMFVDDGIIDFAMELSQGWSEAKRTAEELMQKSSR